MKDFLKYTLATITGVVLSGVLLFALMFIMLIGVLASSSDQEVVLNEPTVLTLKLDGVLSERAVDNPLLDVLGSSQRSNGLKDILDAIEKAKKHSYVKGIYIDAGNLNTSFASLQAIRSALLDFKESGKFIIAYADQYSQGLYYLASVADDIHLNPRGALDWKGLSVQPMFYADILNNVGVDVQVFKVGTYKSAVEPYIETKMSDANREQMSVFLNDIWSNLLADVSKSRSISVDKLNQCADEMLLYKPAEYVLQQGFVDKLSYRTDMENVIKDLLGEEKPRYVSFATMKKVTFAKEPKSEGNIAVYYAEGAIVDQSAKYKTEIIGDKVVKDLKALEEDDRIKAVVLRVNSPGGSAYASEQIWKAVTKLKEVKPVIVSMGDYAASGGYYISAAADWIVAEPMTLTGSIGIFAMIPSFEKVAKKVGLSVDAVKTNKYSDFGGNLFRNLNTEERQLLQSYVESGYDLFIKRCADGRQMVNDSIRMIAEGRVWTGSRAIELGLVNQLGGLKEAIAVAAEKAEITNYRLRSYPQEKSFFDELLELSGKDIVNAYMGDSKLKDIYQQIESVEQLTDQSFLQARLPYILNFN